MTTSINILLVDDDEDDFFLTKDLLDEIKAVSYNIDWASSYDIALDKVQLKPYDAYLVDYRLGRNTGIDLITHFTQMGDHTPFIILTGKGDTHIDIEAGRLGAADYLIKGEIDSSKLERSIRYAIQRAEASEAIKNSEQKFRALFEQSKDGIFIISKDGALMDINQTTAQLFSIRKDQLIGTNLKKLFQEKQEWADFMDAIAQKGSVSDMEVMMCKTNGEIMYCLLAASTQYDAAGNASNYQGIIHNITDRKIAELNSRMTEKLDLTGRMARMIAHEVRNPLTNVNLALAQLKNELDNPDPGLDFYFDIIKRNCERINNLISQLMNSALLEYLRLKEYPLNQIVEDSLNLAHDRITLNEIQVDKSFEALNCYVLIDAEKMRIALLNILINAVEAMQAKKGKLSISTYCNNDNCFISIKDNGKGIEPSNLKKLFEPFYTDKEMGSGLGLTSTHNIIKSHQGKIDVQSNEDGTLFEIELKKARGSN